jgi:hypothetical protein
MKLVKFYTCSSALLLLATALAKLVSSMGADKILQTADPIFGIHFRTLFWLVGGVEALVALACFWGKRIELQVGLLIWLATSFLLYRVGLILVHYQHPCPCLGTLTGMLHISENTAQRIVEGVLTYLLFGGFASLLWLINRRGQNEMPVPALKTGAKAG